MSPARADALARLADARARGLGRVAVPLTRRLSADLLTPVSAFLALREGARLPFLLESVEGGERAARYSFLGRDPHRVVRAWAGRTDVEGDAAPAGADVLGVLRAWADERAELPVPGLPRLTGGLVGYLGYDCVRLVEHLPDAPPDALGLPDAVFGDYRSVVAFDHVRHQLVLVAQAWCDDPATDADALDDAEAALDALAASLRRARPAKDAAPVERGDGEHAAFPRDAYTHAVGRARHHIYEGDVFQLVLSRRTGYALTGDPFALYRALRQVNPSPYLFYFDFGPFQLAGASPEVLVRVEDRTAEVWPIAGTRRRGADEAEDAALEADLRQDTKERAEHLMLVDLARNDLGRVCAPGTVTVGRFETVERYSHVMHLVSQVTGRLKDDAHPLDALAAAFPAGTLTGAPKVRAMQLIDALEPERRGVYGGAVGYVDRRGTLDTCIAIRTMVVAGGRVHLQAGAGIVADSDPDLEFEETVAKARALRTALDLAASELL